MSEWRERESGGGGGLVSTPPKSITGAFVCDISGVCCHCHMASQGSVNWFRADTVIVDPGCSPFTIPSGALGLIPRETQPVTEVRGETLTRPALGLFRLVFSGIFMVKLKCLWALSIIFDHLSLVVVELLVIDVLMVVLFKCCPLWNVCLRWAALSSFVKLSISLLRCSSLYWSFRPLLIFVIYKSLFKSLQFFL